MRNLIYKIFWPPKFDDQDKSRAAAYLNILLWVSLLLLTVLRVYSHFSDPQAASENFFTNPISILIGIIAFLLLVIRFGYVREASFFLLIAAWAALTVQARSSGGVFDTAFLGNFVIIMLAGLLLGNTSAGIFAALAIISGWVLAYLQVNNALLPKIDLPYNIARDDTIIIILISLVSYLTTNGLRNALKHSSSSAAELLKSNNQLNALHADLEKLVEERTFESKKRSDELETVSLINERRAAQLQAVAQVGHAITSVQSLQSLLPRVAGVIAKQFMLYHVGIFLLDDAREYAILSASNSPGGQKMIDRGHRLLVGTEGIVGHTAKTGQPHIAADIHSDPSYFANPDLPNTQSEASIPLKIGDEIMGVLDIQSEKPFAYGETDIELLTILADQVTIAIQNARRFQELQIANHETETLYRESVRTKWFDYASENENAGYLYSGTSIKPIEQRLDNPNIRMAIQNKTISITQETAGSRLAIPIQLRGQVVGLINVEFPGNREWNRDEIDISKSIAERVALAIENARLFEETTDRAERERTVSQITSKIRSTNDPNQMIEIALEELKQALHVKDARIVPFEHQQSPDKV